MYLLPASAQHRASARLSKSAALAASLVALLTALPLAARPLDGDDASATFGVSPPPRSGELGLMFDVGSLDGGMLSLVYRPLPWLRGYGGAGTNGAAPGVKLGTTLSPFRHGLAVSLEGGHFFPGDVNGIFAAFAGSEYDHSRALEHFDYDFVNLQGGWEIERGGLLFFARAGVGYVWSQVPAAGLATLRHRSSLVDADGNVRALLPSAQVGFIGFF